MNRILEYFKTDILLALIFALLIGLYIVLMLIRFDNRNFEEASVIEHEPEIIIDPITTEEELALEEPKLYRREVTQEEYQLLLRVCMSETGGGKYGEPMEGKVAVVETILNRVDMGMGTIEEVVSSAYSTANNGEPDEIVIQAVEQALTGEDDFPDNMIAFRAGNYHSFGVPYKKIGNHYFSCLE